jgi:peptidoglycan hydrolase CwlO-like protein
MKRMLRTMAVGALGAWLLTSTGCEDKVCQDSLQTCKKDSEQQRKECSANLEKLQELKLQLSDAQAKVDSLGKENDELKQAAEAAKSKTKSTKGKRKKRARR